MAGCERSVWASLFTSVLILSFAPTVGAISYSIRPRFDFPIGTDPISGPEFRDTIVYNASTGELIYEATVERIGGNKWWPTDLVSKSGLFRAETNLLPVPATFNKVPEFRTNEAIAHQLVNGSNGLHIDYDPYWFWPSRLSDPYMLAQFGLSSVPDSYSFGSVLPSGLTREFVQSDLYSFPDAVLVYRVPEPSLMIGILAVIIPAIINGRGARTPRS